MIRIILFAMIVGAVVYFALLLKERYRKLSPDKQQHLLSFLIEKSMLFIRSRYHIVGHVLWTVVRGLIKK